MHFLYPIVVTRNHEVARSGVWRKRCDVPCENDQDRRVPSFPIVHRFRPPDPKPQVGGYDLDAFVIEEDEAGDFDFRFELGMGLGIFWALPAALGDRLRLLHVDGAAYTVDEPELYADPFVAHFGPITFEKDGMSVTVELTENPQSYVCVVFAKGRAPVELRWPDHSATET